MRDRLQKIEEGLDYNHLSFEDKQAAQALVEAAEAKFVVVDGRMFVKKHAPQFWKRLVTMGAFA